MSAVGLRTAAPSALARAGTAVRDFEDRLLTRPLAPYGIALSRILAGLTYVGILVTNFGHRQILFGAASDWERPMREVSAQAGWLHLENVTAGWFTLLYLGVIVVGVAYVLGWHTRLTGLALVVGAVQILEMNPTVGDQGDNILRIGFLLVLLADGGAVWSFDARRRRTGSSGPAWWSRWTAQPFVATARVVVHNGAVIALACQLVIVYISAAMFKVAGNGWKFGSAISYPLRLDEYRVWPFLNDWAVGSAVVVWLTTYFAVFLQLYFPVLLLNKVTRRIALVLVLMLHLGIAVLLGLPWFTLAMVAFDGIFVSTATYQALERWLLPQVRGARQFLGRRLARST